MKLISLIGLLFLTLLLTSCSNHDVQPEKELPEYMTKYENPAKVTYIEGLFSTKEVWVTHVFEMNDNQLLVYGPKVVKHGSFTYINNGETWLLFTCNPDKDLILPDCLGKYIVITKDVARVILTGE